jgi:hypothetical protein
MVLPENERVENMRERCTRRKKKGGGDWESCEERGERPSFFLDYNNMLGSYSTSQASP